MCVVEMHIVYICASLITLISFIYTHFKVNNSTSCAIFFYYAYNFEYILPRSVILNIYSILKGELYKFYLREAVR